MEQYCRKLKASLNYLKVYFLIRENIKNLMRFYSNKLKLILNYLNVYFSYGKILTKIPIGVN